MSSGYFCRRLSTLIISELRCRISERWMVASSAKVELPSGVNLIWTWRLSCLARRLTTNLRLTNLSIRLTAVWCLTWRRSLNSPTVML